MKTTPLTRRSKTMTTDERIRSLIEYLDYDYSHDRISSYYYSEYLKFLEFSTTDTLMQSKIHSKIVELQNMHPDEVL